MSDDAFAALTQDNVLAAFHHAAALQQDGRLAEAAGLWARIAAAAPQSAEARFNLGVSLFDLERFDDAEAAFRGALALKPAAPWAHHRLANLLHATGRWPEAEPLYHEALSLEPASLRYQLDLGHLLLGLGAYDEGWPLFEARKGLPGQNADPLPLSDEWRGEPLDGRRLLVWPEQGFGDQIMFARFVPALARLGADITLVAPPELTALFQGLGVRVVEQEPELTLPTPDAWTLIGSLPARLGVTLESLPAGPYLAAPADRRARWRGRAPKGAVGVLWQGRATPNPHRSLPGPDAFRPLLNAGANLLHLQPGPGEDFADLAALIEQLDLVITVDTAAAHLAGALGKPVWILLPWFKSDWRWMQGRDDSPWYPSARLFRQTRHGDWAEVMGRVADAWLAFARGLKSTPD